MASTILLKAGQNPLVYTGAAALTLANQAWYTSANVSKVFIPSPNNQGFVSGTPGNSFGVTTLPVAATGRRSGVVVVAKQDFSVDAALFGPLPKPVISGLGSVSRAPGDSLTIPGTALDTAAYVLVGGVSALIDSQSLTSTSVTVTVPLLTAQSNVPVVVITSGGYSNVLTTLSVTNGQTKPIRRGIARLGQSNNGDKSLNADANSAPLSAYPTLNDPHPNLPILVPSTGQYAPVQNGVNDLALSDPTDCGGVAPGGGSPYPPTRGIFAGALALRLAQLYPGETFYYVKKTADGQSMQAILAGGGWRADMYSRLAAARAAGDADGYTFKLSYVLLQFGENDFAAGRAFAPLANQLIQEMKQEGYADNDTIFVTGGLKDSDGIDKSDYRAQMQAWAATDPAHKRYASSDGWQGLVNDDIHLNAVTQMQMGNSDFPNAMFGTTGGFRISSGSTYSALRLDGGAGVVAAPSAGLRITGQSFNIKTRFKHATIQAGCYPFTCHDQNNGPGDQYSFYHVGNGVYSLFLASTDQGVVSVNFPAVNGAAYDAFEADYGSGVLTLKLDNQIVYQQARTFTIQATPNPKFYVGFRASAPNWYGDMDYLTIVNNGVTVADYQFNGNGNDASGQSNNLGLDGQYSFV